MSIKEKFIKRKEYEELNNNFEYPKSSSLYTEYYLDSWNISPFYGKVDTLGIPIMPNLTSIKYCSYGADKNKVSVLEPVNNFFFPFREQYLEYYSIGSINKNSPYYKKDIPPIKGYLNGNLEYQEKIRELYTNFVQFLIDTNKFNYIINYDLFIKELINYIKIKELYFTRAGYVESYDYSLLHTGLAIEIHKESSSNDEERINFFNDINNNVLLELCVRNNLKIDREIPWRVYADIRTKPRIDESKQPFKQLNFRTEIQNYIPEFTDKLQLFFDTYYTRVVPYDEVSYPYFIEFTEIIKSYYTSFISSYPTYTEYNVGECNKSSVVKKSRQNVQVFDYEFFLELYLNFRNLELSKVVPEDILKYHTDIAVEMFKLNNKKSSQESLVITSVKYHTDNIGTLAYRSPSLYELDKKTQTP